MVPHMSIQSIEKTPKKLKQNWHQIREKINDKFNFHNSAPRFFLLPQCSDGGGVRRRRLDCPTSPTAASRRPAGSLTAGRPDRLAAFGRCNSLSIPKGRSRKASNRDCIVVMDAEEWPGRFSSQAMTPALPIWLSFRNDCYPPSSSCTDSLTSSLCKTALHLIGV
jgi:hypothetical protein